MSTTSDEQTTVTPSTKDICRLYFGKKPLDGKSNTWRCQCGNERKCDVITHGYSNLMTHIKSRHPDYLKKFADCTTGLVPGDTSSQGGQRTLDFLIDKKSFNSYKWIDWIVMDEHELNFCEKPRTRENTSLEKMSSKTLKKIMFQLVSAIEKNITKLAEAVPCFALIFDGWSENNTHFVGKFFNFSLFL
jgi:hypothetical protein